MTDIADDPADREKASSDADANADVDTDGDTNTDADGEVEIEITRGMTDPRRATDGESDDHATDGNSTPRETRPDAEHTVTETDLADELGRIDVMTTPEGYVEGRIAGIDAVDARTVRLAVSLPHGETVTFTLEKPIPWSEEFLLARLVEDVGYDAASIDHVVGEPVYLQRTDREPTDEDDWWSASVRTASDALVTSLSGGRLRLNQDDEPEWRLVDPLERPDSTRDDGGITSDLVGSGLIVVGAVVAALGAVVGATGGLVLSPAVVGYAAIGLLIVFLGLAVVFGAEAGERD